MREPTKQPAGIRRRVAWLAVALLILLLGSSGVRADGAAETGRTASASVAPTRVSPTNRARQRLAEQRARARALAGKRDPFKLPPTPKKGAGVELYGSLPPGIRGLVIGRLKLKGIVREDATHNMIAVVTNGTNLAYFLRVHQQVYNGSVTKITPDAIYFTEKTPDPGGRGDAREVVLKLGSAR